MKSNILGLIVLAGLMGSSAAAMAQQMGPMVMRACRSDISRLCGNVDPGHGHIKQCMKQHIMDVSPGCLKALVKAKQSQ